MAITLQITDGTDTVDFNDGTNLYLAEAFQMNIGDGAVNELIISGWLPAIDTDAKAVITKKFNRLIRKAILHYSERRIDRAVWLVWKPDDQTDTQYCKVMGGGEVEVVNHTVGGLRGGRFAPNVIREGGWRSVAPDGTAGETVVNAVTRYNKIDADGNNYVDIASSRTNDMPALLDIWIQNNAAFDNVIVAMRRFVDTTEANKFVPHFNPTDQVTAHSTSADASAPADLKIDLTSTNTISYKIADTDLPSYYGNYDIYIDAYTSTTDDTWTCSYGDDYQTGAAVNIKTGSTNGLTYLGNFNIPATDINPLLTLTGGMDMQIDLVFTEASGTDTLTFIGMFLIPNEIPPIKVQTPAGTISTANRLVLDGTNQLSYPVLVADGLANYDVEVVTKGRYLTSYGGELNRLYFYAFEGTDYVHNDTFTITVKAVDRFVGLRGNT